VLFVDSELDMLGTVVNTLHLVRQCHKPALVDQAGDKEAGGRAVEYKSGRVTA